MSDHRAKRKPVLQGKGARRRGGGFKSEMVNRLEDLAFEKDAPVVHVLRV